MWTYQISGGILSRDGMVIGTGYSGNGADLNNAGDDSVTGHGPIPVGSYTIGTWFDDPGGKGPIVCHLIPFQTNEMYGRAGFMIHGDNTALDHTASDGCIILNHTLRLMMRQSASVLLEVIA